MDDKRPSEAEHIQTETLHEIQLESDVIQAMQTAWSGFINQAHSREAAGDMIYAALFESAPSLQNLFTTPRSVQAMKFIVGINTLVMNLGDVNGLMVQVETLGFQHLHLDVTPARVVIFRDAMIRLFEQELGDKLTPIARFGLLKFLNHVGGAIIFVQKHYAERLRLLADSWAMANEMSSKDDAVILDLDNWSQDGRQSSKEETFSNYSGEREKKQEILGAQTLPTTFEDMFTMSAAVMGLRHVGWMNEVISQFNEIVTNVSNSTRLKEECDVLSLRLAFHNEQHIKLMEFKSCMLAAMRSLLPKHWTTQHEIAWAWLWENVSRMLATNIGKPIVWRKALDDWLEVLDDNSAYDIRKNIYARFFSLAPSGQEYFNRSSTRLHYIAERIFQMVSEIYAEPVRMVKEISALGLRHVGFGIPTDLFCPFVTACVEVLDRTLEDKLTLEAFRWSLGLISRILVRTINEGLTVVMKALNANCTKQLKKAISGAPRAERATWLLLVKVGVQSISPLAWAIESGKLDVAAAMLTDLLTIRADRKNYYYGGDELFQRHNDIVKKLCIAAPSLLPSLFEGLIWRSHRSKGGFRRVNYYIESLLINTKGDFSDALRYIVSLGDPAVMVDSVVVLVSDTLWKGIIYRQFLKTKTWNIISLIVFMLAQLVLPRTDVGPGSQHVVNIIIFLGKLFTYILGMGRLGFALLVNFYIWSRKELKRIFEEIDQDGNGDIDFEEFMEAMSMFKQLIKDNISNAVNALKDDGKYVAVDTKNKYAGSENNSNTINLLLFGTLVAMCTTEPMLHCTREDNFPTNDCEASERYAYWYSFFTMCSMAVHWLVIIDLSVFSIELSAFLLVIQHVLLEVKQLLIALSFLLLTFASAISIICRDCTDLGDEFGDIVNAVILLFAITVNFYQGDFRDLSAHPSLVILVLICTTFSAVLLLNLLVAQVNLSYEYIYRDMQGFARLKRASKVCDAMSLCSRSRWNKFKASLGFQQKLEFDEGDIGISGGLQVMEDASVHRTSREQILRFGGSTSRQAPWPESKGGGDGGDRFQRLESMLQKAIKQIMCHPRKGSKSGASDAASSLAESGVDHGEGSVGSTHIQLPAE